MPDEEGYFESTEKAIINVFDDFRKNQPSIEKIIRELENKKVKFARQGEIFWGIAEGIGPYTTNYHILSTKDHLSIYRGTIHENPNKVAYYKGKESDDFYNKLLRTVPEVKTIPYNVPWG